MNNISLPIREMRIPEFRETYGAVDDWEQTVLNDNVSEFSYEKDMLMNRAIAVGDDIRVFFVFGYDPNIAGRLCPKAIFYLIEAMSSDEIDIVKKHLHDVCGPDCSMRVSRQSSSVDQATFRKLLN
jgi:hypothetical protein